MPHTRRYHLTFTEFLMDTAALARPAASQTINPTPAFEWSAKAFAGFEKVVELNVQTIKTSLSEQQALANAAISSQSFDEVVDLQMQQMPAALKKTFAYWRHMEEIALETRNDLAAVLAESVQRSLAMMPSLVDHALSAADDATSTVQLIGAQASHAVENEAVAIVDSAGNVVSSGGSPGGLH